MMQFFKTYIVVFVVFMVIDMLWLGILAKKLYRDQIGFLLKSDVNWIAAIAFYLLYVVGLIVFVVEPAILRSSASYALLAGMFFGFVSYATYDLTNLATIKDWPLSITFIDMAWGTTLGGLTSYIGYILLGALGWR